VAAVLGTLRTIGLERVLSSRSGRARDLVTAMIVARVIAPGSKLATRTGLQEATAHSSLGGELRLGEIADRELYDAMDWLLARQARIEHKLAAKHLADGTLVLYDVSSSYYTGRQSPLVKHGYSRDGKPGEPQIVYGLLCNADGCPVAVEVFAGNTADPSTLRTQIEKLRKRFGLARVVLVGDRGMITSKRIDEELRDVEGLDWITALRADSIKKLAAQGTIQPSLFDERDLAEVTSPEFPGERLIVCRNPLLAEERARKRDELLAATEHKLQAIAAAVSRASRPLRGKDQIALRVGRDIGRYKMAKHFALEMTDESFTFRRREQQIADEATLDGLYVIRTSVAAEALSAEQTVGAYKNLSKVERAFRSLKTVDLKVRPIYHWKDDRIRAHVFLCLLAYYVEWHMRQKLAPILFDDHDRAAAELARPSIVAPAPRSAAARRKDHDKHTTDEQPVQSFQCLLKDLATLCKNRVHCEAAEFDQLTLPTHLQRHTFHLLDLPPTT
jgi:transposase